MYIMYIMYIYIMALVCIYIYCRSMPHIALYVPAELNV